MHDLSQNTGWAKRISRKLEEYELETDWENIKKKSPNEWKESVRKAVLRMNGKKTPGKVCHCKWARRKNPYKNETYI